MIINLNDKVSVVLTQSGADRLNQLNARLPIKSCQHLYCENEVYKTQLWCLFEDFGDLIGMCKPTSGLPFKSNNIKYLEF